MQQRDRKQRNKVLGWVALALAALGVLVFVLSNACRSRPPLRVAVYYEGNPDINNKAAVLFRKEVVGEIDSIHAGLPCLHLVVRRADNEDWQESATVELDSVRRVGDNATRRYVIGYRREAVTIASAADTARHLVTIERGAGTATWFMRVDTRRGTATGSEPEAVTLNEKPADTGRAAITASDEIGIGNGLRIRWAEPAIHACVFMHLDTARINALANLRTVPITATLATLSTGFALARPGVRLTLPPVGAGGSLVHYAIPEMMTGQDFDLYAVLNDVGGYLTDKRRMFSPPHNRIERAVNDANNGLDNLDSIVAAVKAVTSEAGDYLTSPAALRARPRNRIDSLIADLNALRGIVDAARNDISTFSGKAGHAVENIDRTTVPSLNNALEGVASATKQVNILSERLGALSTTLKDTTLYRVEGSLKSVADDVDGVRDEVRRLVHSLNMLLIKLP